VPDPLFSPNISTGGYGMNAIPCPQEIFEAELLIADELIRRICHRHRLSHEEAEDFHSFAMLKLIEDDYARLRSFQGRSRLKTFLTVILHHLFLDYRVQKWGKWRPPAEVRQLGRVAVELDRLLSRDGQTLENAVKILCARSGGVLTRRELVALADRLPQRQRWRLDGLEILDEIPTDGEVEERIQNRERKHALKRIAAALREALRETPAEDRLLLKMRYENGFTIRHIAKTLHVEARPLYARFEQCHRRLRSVLRRSGITWSDVTSILGWAGTDLRVDFDSPKALQRHRTQSSAFE
jgi:RNA polymerase sigma factor (sigma-70 family)